LLRDGAVVPVVGALEEEVQRRRDVDLVGVVRWAGLQQQHARGRVLRQARGEDAPGAAGTNDDVVVHGHLLNHRSGCRRQPYRRARPPAGHSPGAHRSAGPPVVATESASVYRCVLCQRVRGWFVGGGWCAGCMPRRRAPGSPQVVCRTARPGLRVTGGSGTDCWVCWCRRVMSGRACWKSTRGGGPGRTARWSPIRNYAGNWPALGPARSGTWTPKEPGPCCAVTPTPGSLLSNAATKAIGRRSSTVRVGPGLPGLPAHGPPRPFGGGQYRRQTRRRDHAGHSGWRYAPPRRGAPSRCRPPRDVTHAAAPITAAPAGPLAGTGPPPPAP